MNGKAVDPKLKKTKKKQNKPPVKKPQAEWAGVATKMLGKC